MDTSRQKKEFSASLNQWLLISSAFSCLLLIIRIVVTNEFSFLFLPWNLFLAFIPYWIARWLVGDDAIYKNRTKLVFSLLAWLLFIPNSFYIITDLFHLKRFNAAPAWFDLLMIFSFAWNGIVCGIISLGYVEKILTRITGKKFSILVILGVMWLNAFGIYIGRFLRFNSWDIITDPFSLAGEIMYMIIHPLQYGYAWGMTICYAIFMSLVYLTIKKASASFQAKETA